MEPPQDPPGNANRLAAGPSLKRAVSIKKKPATPISPLANTATARRLLNIACPAPAKLLTKANWYSYYYFYPIKKNA